MINKKGNVALLVVACVLTAIVIAFTVFAIYSGVSSNQSNKTADNKSSSTSNSANNSKKETSTTSDVKDDSSNNTTDKKAIDEEEKLVEEVKKIDEAQGNIYENNKIPVINLTTKAATRINSEIETKYKESSKNGYYIIYSYYMYTGMVTLILDDVYSDKHVYEVYNVDLKTGKQMKNEDLLTKLNVSKEDFNKKAKEALTKKFEEINKDANKNSNEYKSALNNTINSVENLENNVMYINLEGKFALYGKFSSISDSSVKYELVEF